MTTKPHLIAFLVLAVLVGCDGKKTEWPTPAANPAVKEARGLLTEAGYPFGEGFPELEILYNTLESHKKIAAAIQEMWRKNLGIDVQLRNVEWKVYLDHMTRVDYQIMRRGWIGDYPDPNTFIDMFTTGSGNNNTNWSSEEYDRLVDEAARMRDPAERLKVLQRAERLLMDELPILPVYFYVTQSMWRSELRGVYANAMDVHPIKDAVLGDGSGVFVMNVGAEPQTLDPGIQHGQPEHRVNIAFFEGLTTYHPERITPQPGVAESWTTSEDGLTWTFKLRESKWTNGRKVTAGDFVYAWRRVIDPAVASQYAYIIFNYLKNAKAYYDGASADLSLKDFSTLDDEKREAAARGLAKQACARHVPALKKAAQEEKAPAIKALLEEALASAPGRPDATIEDVGVRAVDDQTLVVELESPTPYFLYLTSFFSYFPIPREVIEEHGDQWTRPGKMVNNGPFVMKEWVPNSHILAERNLTYWDAANVKQKQVKFLPIDNINTAFNMYEAGQCHYLDTVPLEFVDALRKRPDFHSIPFMTVYFYGVNVKAKPLDDVRIRRALALAIDRETICTKILKAGQTPAYSIVPRGLPGYESQTFTPVPGPR